jgi:hypothetical protein
MLVTTQTWGQYKTWKKWTKKREGSRSEEEKGKTYIKANQDEEDEKREQN